MTVDWQAGFVDYRLMVEGWPHQWVTSPRIWITFETFDGRVLFPGLAFDGLRISERMILREGWPEVAGITATIVPTDFNEDTLSGFTRDARPVAELVDTLDPGTLSWTTRPPDLPSGAYHVATETMLCDGLNTITRGYWDTIPQRHLVDDGFTPQPVHIYNWPPSMEGRHAYLYAYTSRDIADATGGTLVWRGVVTQPPRMASDGVSWTIEIGPITGQFDQVLGSPDKIQYKVRGIYHSDRCPMTINVYTNEDLSFSEIRRVRVMGFFETQAALDAAVNSAMSAAVAAAGSEPNAQFINYVLYSGTGDAPYFTVGCTSQDFPVTIFVDDALDGDTAKNSPGSPTGNNVRVGIGEITRIQCGDAVGAFLQSGFSTLLAPWAYPLPLARCLVGARIPDRVLPIYVDRIYNQWVDDPAYPHDRVYLTTVDGLEVGDTLVVKNGDTDVRAMTITAIDAVDQFITVTFTGDQGIYISSGSEVVPLRVYGEDTHFAGFMTEVLAQAPEANSGNTPWLTEADVFDIALWELPFTLDAIDFYWLHRNYRFIKQVRVRDVIAPELMVIGYMARLEADGRVGIARMPFVSAVRTADHTLTDDEILLPADPMAGIFPTWEAQSDGLVNIAKVRLGYNPVSDEFSEYADFVVRVVSSIAEHKSGDKASQDIEVRSTPSGRPVGWSQYQDLTLRAKAPIGITSVQVVDAITPYLRCLSSDYASVTVAVPFTKFDVLVGDIVQVTSAFIPDGQGGRGVLGAKSICVGRTWELDPAANGMGTLTLWFPRNPPTGYAPTGRITSTTGPAGVTWVLGFDSSNAVNIAWAETDAGDVVLHFAVNDLIQVVQVDSLIPVIVTGIVIAVAAGEITVDLDDTWTPGPDTWNLRFAFVGAQVVQRQQTYCWVADDTALLVDDTPAREFV